MSKKKKKDKKKNSAEQGSGHESELQRLREENEMLRARLEKIRELSADLPRTHEAEDDEDEEYEELQHDVDDLISNGDGDKRVIVPSGGDHS